MTCDICCDGGSNPLVFSVSQRKKIALRLGKNPPTGLLLPSEKKTQEIIRVTLVVVEIIFCTLSCNGVRGGRSVEEGNKWFRGRQRQC